MNSKDVVTIAGFAKEVGPDMAERDDVMAEKRDGGVPDLR